MNMEPSYGGYHRHYLSLFVLGVTAIILCSTIGITGGTRVYDEADPAMTQNQYLTDDVAINLFAEYAELNEAQKKVLIDSLDERNVTMTHRIGDQNRMCLEGHGTSIGKNLRCDHTYCCNYEILDGEWVPYDWSWDVSVELGMPAGTYRAAMAEPSGNMYYLMRVHYDNNNIARIDLSSHYQDTIIWSSPNLDYDAFRVYDDYVTFIYQHPVLRQEIELRVYTDGQVTLAGCDVEPWPDAASGTSHDSDLVSKHV